MSIDSNRSAALEFMSLLGNGRASEAAIAADFAAWTILSGELQGQEYLRRNRAFPSIFNGPLAFTVDATTAESDRVIVECRSQGTLVNNTEYRNTYVFVFLFEANLIKKVFEYFNVKIALDVLIPVLRPNSPAA